MLLYVCINLYSYMFPNAMFVIVISCIHCEFLQIDMWFSNLCNIITFTIHDIALFMSTNSR